MKGWGTVRVFVVASLALALLSSPAFCTSIDNIVFSVGKAAALPFSTNVDITMNYKHNETAGVRIWATPYTNGSITPNRTFSGSAVIPSGSGAISRSFTVTSGEVTVDQVRFMVYDNTGTTPLHEFYVPVSYLFHGNDTTITNINIKTYTPSTLAFGRRVDLTFDYSTTDQNGILIWAQPMTNGATSSNMSYEGSSFLTGSGSQSRYFGIISGDIRIDHVKLFAKNSTQTTTLADLRIPVEFYFLTDPTKRMIAAAGKPGDFDGDGKSDFAVWRSGTGTWYVLRSTDGGVTAQSWGSGGENDVTMFGDYDGDGKTDYAVWRPATGTWYVLRSSDGGVTSQNWGLGSATDTPVAGDFDGDGKTDFAVWRSSTGTWYVLRSSDGGVTTQNWGLGSAGDSPAY